MIGPKTIEEFSLKDCEEFLGNTDTNNPDWKLVDQRKKKLIAQAEEAKKKEAERQRREHQLTEETKREEVERLRRERRLAEERRRRKKRVLLIVFSSIVVVGIVVFFIGYKPVRSLQVEDVSFGKEGGEKIIRIETNVGSSAIDLIEPETDWVSVTKEGKKLTISAIANPDPERTCTISIEAYSTFFGERIGNSIQQEVMIHQSSGYAENLFIDKPNLSYGKFEDSELVNIKTDGVGLELSSNKEWIHCSIEQQNHDGNYYHDDTYRITADKNPKGDRRGKVIVTTGGQPAQEITITQASGLANKFEVSAHSIGPVSKLGTPEGRCFLVDIFTDGTIWEASTSCRWLSLNKNNNRLEIEVRPADEVRDGEVYVSSNNGHRETISIHQDGDPTSFYVSSSSLTFDTDSDYKEVSITNNSNQSVEASTDKSWLKASVFSGNKVRVSCESNNNSPQDGVVTLSCGRKEIQIKVHQYGYKNVACSNCLDLWGYPTGTEIEYLPYYPWTRIVNCRKCGGCKFLKQKAYYN